MGVRDTKPGAYGDFATRFQLDSDYQAGNTQPAVGVDSGRTNSAVNLATQTAYLIVGKWEDTNADNTWDKGTMWVLSASNYDAIKAAGVTEAELNATYTVKVTDTASTGVDFQSTYYQTLAGYRTSK
jgi:hypothetical protein